MRGDYSTDRHRLCKPPLGHFLTVLANEHLQITIPAAISASQSNVFSGFFSPEVIIDKIVEYLRKVVLDTKTTSMSQEIHHQAVMDRTVFRVSSFCQVGRKAYEPMNVLV